MFFFDLVSFTTLDGRTDGRTDGPRDAVCQPPPLPFPRREKKKANENVS